MDYSFLNLNNLDQRTSQYFDSLFSQFSDNRIDGARAVQFFKLSGLEMDVLREIWNLSSVYKQPFLVKLEFFLYLKYVSLAQYGYFDAKKGGVYCYNMLRQYNQFLDLPKFQGIQLPQQLSYNPFDQEDDWAAFEEAKPANPPPKIKEEEDPFAEVLNPKPKIEEKKEINIDIGFGFGKKVVQPVIQQQTVIPVIPVIHQPPVEEEFGEFEQADDEFGNFEEPDPFAEILQTNKIAPSVHDQIMKIEPDEDGFGDFGDFTEPEVQVQQVVQPLVQPTIQPPIQSTIQPQTQTVQPVVQTVQPPVQNNELDFGEFGAFGDFVQEKSEKSEDGFGNFGDFEEPEPPVQKPESPVKQPDIAPPIKKPILEEEDPFADILGEYGIKDTGFKMLDGFQEPKDEEEFEEMKNQEFGKIEEVQNEEFGEFEEVKEDEFGKFEEPKNDDFGEFEEPKDDAFGDFEEPKNEDFGDFEEPKNEDFGDFEEPKNEDVEASKTEQFGNFEEPDSPKIYDENGNLEQSEQRAPDFGIFQQTEETFGKFEDTAQEEPEEDFGDFEEPPEPPKPKIELNESNLLSGFMHEFGQTVPQEETPETPASAPSEEEFDLVEQICQMYDDGPDFEQIRSKIKDDPYSDTQNLKKYVEHVGGNPNLVDQYLENKEKIIDLEKKKKQAAIDEDFEEALSCKKQILNVQSEIESLNTQIQAHLTTTLTKSLSPKDILLEMASQNPDLVRSFLAPNLTLNQILTKLLSQNIDTLSIKISEQITIFDKVLSKLSECLEVSFDDQTIEKQNKQIVTKILQNQKMQNYLKGFNLISAINEVLLFNNSQQAKINNEKIANIKRQMQELHIDIKAYINDNQIQMLDQNVQIDHKVFQLYKEKREMAKLVCDKTGVPRCMIINYQFITKFAN